MLRIISLHPVSWGDEVVILPHKDMTRLHPGDRVDVRVKSATIVSPYKNYDEIKTFEIVCRDDHGYYLYVPQYYSLKDSIVADKYVCKRLRIDLKFLDENIIHIQENMVANVHELDGMKCSKCNDFCPFAEPNQENDTLICWNCRQYPSYR